VFEPIPAVEGCMSLFQTPRPILSSDSEICDRNRFLTNLSKYDRVTWKNQHSNSRNIYWLTRGSIVKSTKASFCADFIAQNCLDKDLKFVYLVRNPFDVVKSKISTKAHDDGRLAEEFTFNPLDLLDTLDPFFKAYFDKYRWIADRLYSEVQFETFAWCLENKWILDCWKARGWHLVTFENLYMDFENEYARLCDFLGIKFPKKILKSRKIKSSTAFSGNKREFMQSSEFQDSSVFLNRWKSFFSDEQVLEVVDVLGSFDIDYNTLLNASSNAVVEYPG